MLRLTEEEYRQIAGKGKTENPQSFSVSPEEKKKGAKYWNTKVYIYPDGYTTEGKKDPNRSDAPVRVYASRREYVRALQLRLLLRTGKISDLKEQPPFELEPSGCYRGQKIRAEKYIADFSYERDGERVVEDVKAFSEKTGKFRTTELFRSKWNRMKARNPELRLLLVDPVANVKG